MKYLLIIAGLSFGLMRGLREGMVMIQMGDPLFDGFDHLKDVGVRCHMWFRWYHALDVAVFTAFAGAVWLLATAWPGWLWFLGCCIAAWETTEIGYTVGRYGRPVDDHERIIMIDLYVINIDGGWIWALHGFRVLLATLLLYYGGAT